MTEEDVSIHIVFFKLAAFKGVQETFRSISPHYGKYYLILEVGIKAQTLLTCHAGWVQSGQSSMSKFNVLQSYSHLHKGS